MLAHVLDGHLAAALVDEIDEDLPEPHFHRGALAEERGMDGCDELAEMIVEPQHVKVLDVELGRVERGRGGIAHRGDRNLLPLLVK